eukprot:5094876-Ditylum_brightwellii.AAC.1
MPLSTIQITLNQLWASSFCMRSRRINLKEENTGLATFITLTCCNCHHKEIVGANTTVLFEKENDLTGQPQRKHKKLSIGRKEAAMLLGSFGTYGFGKVKAALGDVLEEVTKEAMTEALEEEIQHILGKRGKSGLL